MVKAHDTVSRATSGYHGGKKITGRGRHVAVDTEGWLLALVVTAASVSDKAGAKILLIKLFDAFCALKIMNPRPWAPTSISAAMSARQPYARPSRMPVAMLGKAPGRITSRAMRQREAPSVRSPLT